MSLLYERKELRPQIESTAARSDDDVIDLFELDSAHYGTFLRTHIYALTVSSVTCLIEWKNEPTSFWIIPIATFQEEGCRCDFNGRWP